MSPLLRHLSKQLHFCIRGLVSRSLRACSKHSEQLDLMFLNMLRHLRSLWSIFHETCRRAAALKMQVTMFLNRTHSQRDLAACAWQCERHVREWGLVD